MHPHHNRLEKSIRSRTLRYYITRALAIVILVKTVGTAVSNQGRLLRTES